ncbi:hypothetical protein LguiA_002832 [Lonicera macranthoides]
MGMLGVEKVNGIRKTARELRIIGTVRLLEFELGIAQTPELRAVINSQVEVEKIRVSLKVEEDIRVWGEEDEHGEDGRKGSVWYISCEKSAAFSIESDLQLSSSIRFQIWPSRGPKPGYKGAAIKNAKIRQAYASSIFTSA